MRPPSAPAGGAATRYADVSAPHPIAVPSGCLSPRKGGDHGSATSGGVAAVGCGAQLPSMTTATKGAQADGIERQPWRRSPSPLMQRDATFTRSMATNNCVDSLLCPSVCMVSFPQTAYSNSTRMVVGEVCSSLSPAGTHEDHVWFEDRWMVASLCDE
jgi:hypothetical protein